MLIGGIDKVGFGYNNDAAGYEFTYINFTVTNWATFQLRIFIQNSPSVKFSLYKIEGSTYTKMWDL